MDETDILNDYIEFIDINTFIKFEQNNFDKIKLLNKILFSSKDQELLEYIIEKIRRLRTWFLSAFFDFGIKRFSVLSERKSSYLFKKIISFIKTKKNKLFARKICQSLLIFQSSNLLMTTKIK